MAGAGVAQTMGAAGWHVDPDRFQAHSDHCRDACRGQWADGSIDGQKDLWVKAASSVSKITDDRLADDWEEWIAVGDPLLGPGDADHFAHPVKVIQAERCDLPSAKSIERQQQQDCVVANIDGVPNSCMGNAFQP